MAAVAQEILIEYIKENQDKLYKVAYTYTKDKEIKICHWMLFKNQLQKP